MTSSWATRGSQLQLQLYVNRRPDELTQAVASSIPALAGVEIEWLVPREPLLAEPRDEAFLRVLGLEHLADELRSFWPSRGPVWDGLGVSRFADGRTGVVLIEAKSYVKGMYAGGSRAGDSGSDAALANRAQIIHAIATTQQELRLTPDPERWISPLDVGDPSSSLYQTANRIAHAMWLRRNGVEAALCHVLFIDDATFKPTSREDWEAALAVANAQLGIEELELPCLGHAFLPGLDPAVVSRAA